MQGFKAEMKPKAYIFDVFGTLVDWRSSVAREAALFLEAKGLTVDPLDFADYWRGRYQPAMERIRSGARGYISLDTLHRENLEETLAHFSLAKAFSESEKSDLNHAWEKLDPWQDVVDGLTAIKREAIIAPCSNGSIALMTRLAKYGGLPWDCVLGADIAQNYKPDPTVYHACCNALLLQPSEVMMVAAHNSDLVAAQSCGLQTAFIARSMEYGAGQVDDLAPTGQWDRVVTTIGSLAN